MIAQVQTLASSSPTITPLTTISACRNSESGDSIAPLVVIVNPSMPSIFPFKPFENLDPGARLPPGPSIRSEEGRGDVRFGHYLQVAHDCLMNDAGCGANLV